MPQSPTIQAVLIDLDGTLVDSVPALKSAYIAFLRQHGHQGSEQEFAALNGPSLNEVVAYLAEEYAISAEVSELWTQYMVLVNKAYENIQPIDGATELLSQLRSLKLTLALVTASPRPLVQALLQRQGWEYYFEVIITGDDVQHAKPNPELYLRALSMLGISGECAIAVEDSRNGVKSASAAGLHVIAVNESGDEELRQLGAQTTVTSLRDALAAINTAFTGKAMGPS